MPQDRQGREILIKANDEFVFLSQHTLDLKYRKKKEKRHPKGELPVFSIVKNKIVWKDLFFVSFILSAVFFPSYIIGFVKKISAFKRRRMAFGRPPCPVREFLTVAQRRYFSISNLMPFFIKKRSFFNGVSFDFAPPAHWSRGLAAFILMAFVFVLPLKVFSSFEELQQQKDDIIRQGLKGYDALKNNDFTAASISFASAKKTIDNLNFIVKNVAAAIPGIGGKLSFGNGLLVFGENFSNAARLLQGAVNYFDGTTSVVDKIKNLQLKIREAVPYLSVANRILWSLDDIFLIPSIDISPIRQALSDSTKALLVFEDFSDTLLDILGDKHFKRYLFIFQNNNEIRATGGFMGSFALIDIDKGEIKQLEIPGGGTYDVKGQLKELVISPEPFHLINSAWQFQDSNWFPDFPTSAKKIMWFYEKSGGPSVDGVVAVNANLMVDLLRIVGPVDMSDYGRTITADNFMDETQKIVELEYDKTENKPKQFIADMTPKILEKLFKINAKDVAGLADVAHKAILEKDIQVYLKDEETEQELASFGLAGKLKDASDFTDYLMLVDTNIAGQKTDGKIIKEIKHSSEIAEDGTITNTVTITRRHTGVKGALFSGVRNVNYLRLYVPLNSTLIEAEGFKAPPGNLFKPVKDGYALDEDLELIQGTVYVDPTSGTRINNEFGRTVFGNWIMVDPGQEATVAIRYQLPNKLKAQSKSGIRNILGLNNNFLDYKMLVEKQSGAENTSFESEVSVKDKKIVARVGEDVALQNDGWQYETDLDSDKYYGVVLEE